MTNVTETHDEYYDREVKSAFHCGPTAAALLLALVSVGVWAMGWVISHV